MSKPHFLTGYQMLLYVCGDFKVKLLQYLIKYHAINAHIEPSLMKTQGLKIELIQTAADGETVG